MTTADEMIGTNVGDAHGRVRTERGHKRIRTYLQGMVVADSVEPLLVWESPRYPTYFLPVSDVQAQLVATGETQRSPSRGTGEIHDVRIGDARAEGAALVYPDPELDDLAGHVRLDWQAMDAWFEEDEQVYFHPRDPGVRIDALRSTRHVVVALDGEVVADTRAPVILYETGHVPRHYLPATDVRRELLVRSDKVSHCPYKGSTTYYHARLGDREEEEERDLAWSYPAPFAESLPIAGMICFPAERVELTVDGIRQDPA